MRVLGVIPSRYASSRFPGKPLVDVNGKTMIHRMYEHVVQAGSLSKVVVATDDERIRIHVESFGGNVILTAEHHKCGTERCAEALEKEPDFEIVINIQGDQPFVHPQEIDEVVALFRDEEVGIATLATKIQDTETLINPHKPKVHIGADGAAIAFSRKPVPALDESDFEKCLEKQTYYKHIGIYGYRANILKKIAQLEPTASEKEESLEQLRWLDNGYKISVAITEMESYAVDTREDLNRLLDQSD